MTKKLSPEIKSLRMFARAIAGHDYATRARMARWLCEFIDSTEAQRRKNERDAAIALSEPKP